MIVPTKQDVAALLPEELLRCQSMLDDCISRELLAYSLDIAVEDNGREDYRIARDAVARFAFGENAESQLAELRRYRHELVRDEQEGRRRE